jgi:hypothetical protein
MFGGLFAPTVIDRRSLASATASTAPDAFVAGASDDRRDLVALRGDILVQGHGGVFLDYRLRPGWLRVWPSDRHQGMAGFAGMAAHCSAAKRRKCRGSTRPVMRRRRIHRRRRLRPKI